MTFGIFRRAGNLTPIPVTTTPAPILGAHTDVTGDEPQPTTPPPPRMPTPRPEPAATPAPATRRVDAPPTWTPGVCYHDAHFTHDGRRYGLLFVDDRHATYLPCEHVEDRP